MEALANSGLAFLQKAISAAGWHSSSKNLIEAAPHMVDELSSNDLIKTLENLSIPLTSTNTNLKRLSGEDCPALFFGTQSKALAILDASRTQVLVVEPGDERTQWIDRWTEPGTLVRVDRFASKVRGETVESFAQITSGFGYLLPWVILASFVTSLMGLATPLLVMMIYDRVIPSGSASLILSLALASLLVLSADAGFRYARARAIAYMGQTVERRLGEALFLKLMSLPPSQIRNKPVEQQVSRFKQFESVRDFFSGQVFVTLLDLPFTVIFLGVVFWLSAHVGLLVASLAAIFVLLTCATLPIQQSRNQRSTTIRAKHQSFLFETVVQQRNIQRLGLVEFWQKKHEAIAQEAAKATREAKGFQLFCQLLAQSLMMIAGVGAIVLGTLQAIAGDMSFGALIAIMALVWKVLTPLQALFANAPQILGFLTCRDQIDKVLAMPIEVTRGAEKSHQKFFEGKMTLNGVTFRYPDATDPALSQVNISIEAGECVVIAGNSRSGRTTLLETMMGLHPPLVGTVQLDQIDLRQIPVDDLRGAFSYAQKEPDIFHGTLLQNFQLAAPTADENDIRTLLYALALDKVVDGMPDGIRTRLSEKYRLSLPASSLRGLALARSLVRPAQVYLLNEPCNGLDDEVKQALLTYLKSIRGRRTIVVASDDASHIALADRCIFMNAGRILADGIGLEGRRKVKALLSAHEER
ncbi:MAG: ABC transporter transmembrane domain-containing protein [Pseudomonadota bacterium]